MFEERELIALLLGAGVVVFVAFQRQRLSEIPHWPWLALSFGMLFGHHFFSVIEGLFWQQTLNHLQHLCGGSSAALMAIWLSKHYRSPGESARGSDIRV